MKTEIFNVKVNGTSYFVEVEKTEPTSSVTDSVFSDQPTFEQQTGTTNQFSQTNGSQGNWAPAASTSTVPTGAPTTDFFNTPTTFGTATPSTKTPNSAMPTATLNQFTNPVDFASLPTNPSSNTPSTTTTPNWSPNTTTSPNGLTNSPTPSAMTYDPITGTYTDPTATTTPYSNSFDGMFNTKTNGTSFPTSTTTSPNTSYPTTSTDNTSGNTTNKNFTPSWGSSTPETTSWGSPDFSFGGAQNHNTAANYGTATDSTDNTAEAYASNYDFGAPTNGTSRPINEFSFDFEPADGTYKADGVSSFATSVGNNSVLAPTNGRIDAVYVSVGDQVRAGDVLCMLEVEGIKSNIISPVDATVVGVFATVGANVDSHDILISLT